MCMHDKSLQFSSAQSLSRVWLFATPWTTPRQASLSITNSRSLLKLMSVESVMPSNHLILCHPLLLLPPIPPSIRVFSNESTLHIWWPKYWSFSFSISPSNEHPGLISFRMDRLDLLAVQGVLKSLLSVWFFVTPQTVALQAPLSMGFPRQEYWSVLPFPPPGDLPDSGIKPMSLMSPTVAGGIFTTSVPWEAPFLWMGKARSWVHWDHSFDMHLSSLGPVSYSLPAWVALRLSCLGWLEQGTARQGRWGASYL